MYYVRIATRSSGARAKGTPTQAIDYITDGHDSRRDSGYSDAELRYIARMDEGWKTDQEGGRVPLVGLGTVAGEHEQDALRHAFIESCKPHIRRAKTGYKSFTFTIPKEVSLYAEGHRDDARAAMYAAAGQALERAFPGKDYTAVAAIHTRNESGEIHHHVHVLVGKFARDRDTGKTVSLNSIRGGNGPSRVRDLKMGWKEAADREFKERLGLGIEQARRNGPVALFMPDGTRLDPLDRNSRRLVEKAIEPAYTVTDPSGHAVRKVLKLKVMDERIFEVAAGAKGKSGWDAKVFSELFPDQVRFADRHDKRVETLKAAGYLTPEGKIRPAFRAHYALRHGILTPELQRIRLDLARQARHGKSPRPGHPERFDRGETPPTADFWAAIEKHETLRRRVERLGYGREEVTHVLAEAARLRPTPDRLRELRAHGLGAVRIKAPPLLIRAFVRPASPGRGVLTANATPIATAERTLEDDVRRFAEAFLIVGYLPPGGAKKVTEHIRRIQAREVSLPAPRVRESETAPSFRPMFGTTMVAVPPDAKAITAAVERCERLASSEIIRSARKAEIARAYGQWREAFPVRPSIDPERAKRDLAEFGQATGLFKKGLVVLRAQRPAEAARLDRWPGNELELVRQVLTSTKEQPAPGLSREEFEATMRAGKIGHMLDVETRAPPLEAPSGLSDLTEDLQRLSSRLHVFGIENPLGRDELFALAPSEMSKVIEAFRTEGVLTDGPEWVFRRAVAGRVADEVRPSIEREVDADQYLIDRLIAGMRRSP